MTTDPEKHGAWKGGWTFAAIVTAQSGQPYSAYVTNDINNGSERPQRHRAGYRAQPVPAAGAAVD